MTEQQRISIAVSESKGPFPAQTHQYDGGGTIHQEASGSPCPGCGKVPVAGQQITKIFHAWWHDTCGASYLRKAAADEAWLALAHQLERSPSKFSNAETKAITRNLLRIAGRSFTIPEHGHNERVRGRRLISVVPDPGTDFLKAINGFNSSDLYAAVMQAEQRIGSESPAHVGQYAWDLLDDEQQENHLPDLLAAYVEATRRGRDTENGE